MSRLEPLKTGELSESVRATLDGAEAVMGFAANDALTMARNPLLLERFADLVSTLYQPNSKVPIRTKRLVGLMASSAAGCLYCTAHTSHSALADGLSVEDVNELWNYETSQRFTAAETAAIRIAHHGALTPNEVSDEMYQQFAEHFDGDAQVELVGVLSLFGFLNRWNATFRTDVEALPATSLAEISGETGLEV